MDSAVTYLVIMSAAFLGTWLYNIIRKSRQRNSILIFKVNKKGEKTAWWNGDGDVDIRVMVETDQGWGDIQVYDVSGFRNRHPPPDHVTNPGPSNTNE